MKPLSYRYQRTIAQPTEVHGVGYVTGADICLRFVPAPADTGIVFVRTDLKSRVEIPALVDQVTHTQRRTVLGTSPEEVHLVEHVLAALAGMRIDNCRVELNGPEAPGLDGSAAPYVDALALAGVRPQPAVRSIWREQEPVHVRAGTASLTYYPTDKPELKLTYILDYGLGSPLGRQICTYSLTPATFAQQIAHCRTFILESEVEALRNMGLGRRTTTADLLVFGDLSGKVGPIGNRLHHADEPARHKMLDMVGDLALLGTDLQGHVIACRSGHPLNVELVRELRKRMHYSGNQAVQAA